MESVSLLQPADGQFTAILHNQSGRWRVIEGTKVNRAILEFSESIYQPAPRSRVITVFINNQCNLRCSYCRFEPLTHHAVEHGVMNLPRVVSAINSLSNPGETIEIHFQGGEPFLQMESINEVCTNLTESSNDVRYGFHVTTNGTILNNRAISIIQKHKIRVTVSLDGIKSEHDKLRIYPSGQGSFNKAIKTISALQEQSIPFGVFCVVSEPDKLLEIYDYFVNELGLISFLLAPLELDGLTDADELDAYLRKFINGQLKILEMNIDRYRDTKKRISENLTETYLRSKIFPGHYSKACGDTPWSKCGELMHSIERNGDIAECQNTRLIQSKGGEYIKSCLQRFGICENCEIRGHCSSPVCFSRLDPRFVNKFIDSESSAIAYIDKSCRNLKDRELGLFKLFYERKTDVLNYFFAA
ncbi:radical SAM protein [Pseudomonas sp. 32.2.56]|uniref:radical SAM protein n=1 Tax=Pseudomonas sp. 32.2.56 TaxID=2969303 RepID=UPI002150260E|nr:radical SAM protein [Pseudomonas sp. 32.2.56]MCR4507763.1 radical SAM protein [Pseudomonas sp. 32.2.56]